MKSSIKTNLFLSHIVTLLVNGWFLYLFLGFNKLPFIWVVISFLILIALFGLLLYFLIKKFNNHPLFGLCVYLLISPVQYFLIQEVITFTFNLISQFKLEQIDVMIVEVFYALFVFLYLYPFKYYLKFFKQKNQSSSTHDI